MNTQKLEVRNQKAEVGIRKTALAGIVGVTLVGVIIAQLLRINALERRAANLEVSRNLLTVDCFRLSGKLAQLTTRVDFIQFTREGGAK